MPRLRTADTSHGEDTTMTYGPPTGKPEPRSNAFFTDYPFAPTIAATASLRRVIVVRGILGVIVGIAILTLLAWKPVDTLVAFGVFAGAFFAVIGIVRLITGVAAAGLSGGIRALNIVFGVLVGILGFVAMINPGLGLLAMAVMIGVAWVFEGVAALTTLPRDHRGIWVFFGIVSLVAGLAIVALPWATIEPLVIVTGVCLVVFGTLDIVGAVRMARASRAAVYPY
ncbi:MAG: DUF308 domain-containing protein [Bifidobacteriaceae bacterium]|jgi:uncharacterized membrane protein HdeD (DUF308 family)|nr:DUF308 domain-containing protein [Bifidobacteriaceae bacterium]